MVYWKGRICDHSAYYRFQRPERNVGKSTKIGCMFFSIVLIFPPSFQHLHHIFQQRTCKWPSQVTLIKILAAKYFAYTQLWIYRFKLVFWIEPSKPRFQLANVQALATFQPTMNNIKSLFLGLSISKFTQNDLIVSPFLFLMLSVYKCYFLK